MKINRIFVDYSLKQWFRAPVRVVSVFAVSLVLCAFLGVSLNLRQVAQDNLHLLEEEFSVMAIPTFKGYVNKYGRLSDNSQEDYLGFYTVPAFDFDLSQITDAAGVQDVVVYRQFGAYVDMESTPRQEILMSGSYHDSTGFSLADVRDIFIFTYTGEEPKLIYLAASTSSSPIPEITIDWSTRGLDRYSYGGLNFVSEVEYTRWEDYFTEQGLEEMFPDTEEVESVMGTLQAPFLYDRYRAFYLEPGQQYIVCCDISIIESRDGAGHYMENSARLDWMTISADEYHYQRVFQFVNKLNNYDYKGWCAMPEEFHVSYPCILPYTEDFWETEAGAYYRQIIDCCRVNGSALTAIATPDLSLYTPFYQGNVFISEGRSFSSADYEQGNKVCIISAELAVNNGFEIGDKLDLSFFEATYNFTGNASDVTSVYQPLVETRNEETGEYELHSEDIMFDQGEYEIIGFFSGMVTTGISSKNVQYSADAGVDCRIVFIPENSVANLPEVPLSQYNTAILLDDEQVSEFMSAMEDTGLLEVQNGQYMLKFDIYDQGLGTMKQSLRQLDTVSRLTVCLAAAAAVVVVVLLAVLTVIQNRRQIATLRSLGVKKSQLPTVVLSGLLLVCLLGSILGGVLGHTVSDRVATFILDTAQADLADTSFSAMLVKDAVEEEDPYEIAIRSRPETALCASAAVWLSLTLLCCGLVCIEARKSPMLTLGARE